jgi:NAD(P)-dependent dehydrogenase (short-subunit alcohol dehydrogenase family)
MSWKWLSRKAQGDDTMSDSTRYRANGGDYRGKTAVVTGAGSGIGYKITEGLLREGAVVVANDLDLSALENHTGVTPVEGDITNPGTTTALIAAGLAAGSGRIDALFVNAGVGSYRSIVDVTDDEWNRVMTINLDSAARLAGKVAGVMADAGGGSILFTASTSGGFAMTNNAAYVVSKHALVGLARSMAVDLGPRGIRTNVLCPGITNTRMSEKVRTQAPEFWSARERIIPLGRAGEPEEQAEVALFLNSWRASYVNGLVAMVDGGAHALYATSAIKRPQLA